MGLRLSKEIPSKVLVVFILSITIVLPRYVILKLFDSRDLTNFTTQILLFSEKWKEKDIFPWISLEFD